MVDLELQTLVLCCLLPLVIIYLIIKFTDHPLTPRSYPLIGSYPSIFANRLRMTQWISDIVTKSPSLTFVLRRPLGQRTVYTANPATVQHILKTKFHVYEKGGIFRNTLFDLLGDGIFNTDGNTWKSQRRVSSHEFNTRSLRHFVEDVVDSELHHRLLPILATAAKTNEILDFQDVVQRFAFDNICKIAFGYDPKYLLPSFPQAEFAVAFEDAVRISGQRFGVLLPVFWKAKRDLNLGSEKKLRSAVNQVRVFAVKVIADKKTELDDKSAIESVDLLSRFLSTCQYDEKFVTDIIISFILAGRDTTSAALTWFFWLVSRHPNVENEILKEIGSHSEESSLYDEVKDMVYTHASLCETMRLYPSVPVDAKEAVSDDVLPDGTVVKKGMRVAYHPYAMGRVEKLWGPDWAEFRPERWLKRDPGTENWRFEARDSYTYPVFQAGPRICLGKEMAFLQMKRMVAGVLGRYRVIPASQEVEPVFMAYLTSKMKGGFPVRIEERV